MSLATRGEFIVLLHKALDKTLSFPIELIKLITAYAWRPPPLRLEMGPNYISRNVYWHIPFLSPDGYPSGNRESRFTEYDSQIKRVTELKYLDAHKYDQPIGLMPMTGQPKAVAAYTFPRKMLPDEQFYTSTGFRRDRQGRQEVAYHQRFTLQ